MHWPNPSAPSLKCSSHLCDFHFCDLSNLFFFRFFFFIHIHLCHLTTTRCCINNKFKRAFLFQHYSIYIRVSSRVFMHVLVFCIRTVVVFLNVYLCMHKHTSMHEHACTCIHNIQFNEMHLWWWSRSFFPFGAFWCCHIIITRQSCVFFFTANETATFYIFCKIVYAYKEQKKKFAVGKNTKLRFLVHFIASFFFEIQTAIIKFLLSSKCVCVRLMR